MAFVAVLFGCTGKDGRDVLVGPQSIALRLPDGFHEVPYPLDGAIGPAGSTLARAWQAQAAPVYLLVREAPANPPKNELGLRAPQLQLMTMVLDAMKSQPGPFEWLASKVEGDVKQASCFMDVRHGIGEQRLRSLLKIVSDERGMVVVEFRVPASQETDWMETGTSLLASF